MDDFRDEQKKKEQQKRQEQRRLKLNVAFFGVFACVMVVFLLLAFDKIPQPSGNSKKTTVVKKEETETETSTGTMTETEIQKETLAAETTLTISLMGDCTLGTDENFDESTSFNAYYSLYGADYFFQNVKNTLAADDLSIVNFEGTLTTSTERADKEFAFKGDPSYASILTAGSVEAANLANNHSSDYGATSYTDTKTNLNAADITTFGGDETALLEIKGLKVGLVGIYELDQHLGVETQLKNGIANLQSQDADIIIVSFHWGSETATTPDETQVTLAHMAIDEGADLVVGHHPHVLQRIETYNGKTIAYSLGNFCFGGNVYPTDFDTIILQQTFTFSTSRELSNAETKVIPCQVSSTTDYNNYQPVILDGTEATRVQDKLKTLAADTTTAETTASTNAGTAETTAPANTGTDETTASTEAGSSSNTLSNSTQLFLPD